MKVILSAFAGALAWGLVLGWIAFALMWMIRAISLLLGEVIEAWYWNPLLYVVGLGWILWFFIWLFNKNEN